MEDNKFYDRDKESDINIIRHLIKIKKLLGGDNNNNNNESDDSE